MSMYFFAIICIFMFCHIFLSCLYLPGFSLFCATIFKLQHFMSIPFVCLFACLSVCSRCSHDEKTQRHEEFSKSSIFGEMFYEWSQIQNLLKGRYHNWLTPRSRLISTARSWNSDCLLFDWLHIFWFKNCQEL